MGAARSSARGGGTAPAPARVAHAVARAAARAAFKTAVGPFVAHITTSWTASVRTGAGAPFTLTVAAGAPAGAVLLGMTLVGAGCAGAVTILTQLAQAAAAPNAAGVYLLSGDPGCAAATGGTLVARGTWATAAASTAVTAVAATGLVVGMTVCASAAPPCAGASAGVTAATTIAALGAPDAGGAGLWYV